MSPFSHFLHELRLRLEIRQADLAKLVGYEQSYISALEVGLKGPPTQEFITRLIQAVAIAFDLFPPPVPTRLAALIPPGTVATGPVINVSARIHGKIGGEATATDWFTFPVQVVNSGVTAGSCTGTATVHPGACGYGYDTVNVCR